MTQAPTPGPLSAFRVDLGLVATTIETMHRRIEDLTGSRQSQYDGAVALARDLYLSAPTAPVEASGSEREINRTFAGEAIRDLAKQVELSGPHAGVIAIPLWAAKDILAALRPQPSGETREAVRLALEDADALERVSEEADDNQWPDWAATMRQAASRIRRLALTRPAPVASGGQHSSGEGESDLCRVEKAITAQPGVKKCIAHGDISVRQIANAVLRVMGAAPAPVAETAGEAVAWEVWDNPKGPIYLTRVKSELFAWTHNRPLYAPTIPAQEGGSK